MTTKTFSASLLLAVSCILASLACAATPVRIQRPAHAPHHLFQAVGEYHGDLIHCDLTPADQATTLRQQARTELAARGLNMAGFDRDYNIGFQKSIIHHRTMPSRARAYYCKTVARRAARPMR